MAARASAKRKRGSAPVSPPSDGRAARRARGSGGGGASAAAAAEQEAPPPLVEVERGDKVAQGIDLHVWGVAPRWRLGGAVGFGAVAVAEEVRGDEAVLRQQGGEAAPGGLGVEEAVQQYEWRAVQAIVAIGYGVRTHRADAVLRPGEIFMVSGYMSKSGQHRQAKKGRVIIQVPKVAQRRLHRFGFAPSRCS